MALGLGSVDVLASTLGKSTPTPIAAGKLSISSENCCVINEKACIVFLQDYKEYPSNNWDTKTIPVMPQLHEIICPLNLKDINPEVFISRVISISTPFCTQTVAFFLKTIHQVVGKQNKCPWSTYLRVIESLCTYQLEASTKGPALLCLMISILGIKMSSWNCLHKFNHPQN
jgi:hypothetical protein